MVQQTSIATFAGGCFWGVEELLRDHPGVTSTRVGYTGGDLVNPRYEQVKTGTSGHAEAIEVHFDPKRLSYPDLLRFFFRLHDPTTLNRQGNDRGSQYRSTIFCHDDAQRQAAVAVIAEINASGKWPNPVVTQVVHASTFYPAEHDHQKYLRKNPGGYTCHFVRD